MHDEGRKNIIAGGKNIIAGKICTWRAMFVLTKSTLLFQICDNELHAAEWQQGHEQRHAPQNEKEKCEGNGHCRTSFPNFRQIA